MVSWMHPQMGMKRQSHKKAVYMEETCVVDVFVLCSIRCGELKGACSAVVSVTDV